MEAMSSGHATGQARAEAAEWRVLTTESTCAITSQLFAPKDFGPGR